MPSRRFSIAIYHNLPVGGAKRSLIEMAKRLAQRNHHVDVYYLDHGQELDPTLAHVVRKAYSVAFRPHSLFSLNLAGEERFSIKLPERPGTLRQLDETCREVAVQIDDGSYDVAFVHPDRFVPAPYVLRHLRTPSAYLCQEPPRRFYEPAMPTRRGSPPPQPLTYRRVAYLLLRRFVGRFAVAYQRKIRDDDRANIASASLVLANSCYTRESIYRAYGTFSYLLPLGVDSQQFHPTACQKEQMVLSVGSLYPFKGHDWVIRAAAEVPASLRPIVHIVAPSGDIAEHNYLMDLAKQHDVVLTIAQSLSDQELVERYNQAKIVMCTQIMEPFGLVALEAMACATPVIAVREGGFRETVIHGHTGLLVERDVKALVSALSSLLANDMLRNRLGQQAQEYVKLNWSWERTIDVLEEHFLRTMGAK